MAVSTGLGVVALMLLLPRLIQVYGHPKTETSGPFLSTFWWLNATYCGVIHRLRVIGDDPLPPSGPILLVANHTCGVDHMLLQSATRRLIGFMVAREYYDFWACKPFTRLIRCIPVNRDGKDLAGLRTSIRALADGRVLAVFPEGKITPASGMEFGEAKPGAGFLAIKAGVPVVPAYIRGTPPTNDVWKALATRSNAQVRFGPPVAIQPDDDAAKVTERMMDAIKALQAQSFQQDPPS